MPRDGAPRPMHALALETPAPRPPDRQGDDATERTLDLAALARVCRDERVEVVAPACDATQELFDRTVRLVAAQAERSPESVPAARPLNYVPEHKDLRRRFLFAEAIGSYSALHDLLNGYSPAGQLFASCEEAARDSRLTRVEAEILEAYRDQAHTALEHAGRYLHDHLDAGFGSDELRELNAILREARERYERVTAILGRNLVHEVEQAVHELHALEQKMRSVQPTIDGIFLVGSEFMFVPANDLVRIVNTLFTAVGNPYVAQHVDGILLLAARNLLIQVVSFYSYYGRQQIYNVFRRHGATQNRAAVVHHVRAEIRGLFRACKSGNRLVLKRVMASAERDFELSIESIREAAEAVAIAAVDRLLPATQSDDSGPPPGLLRRLVNWLFR